MIIEVEITTELICNGLTKGNEIRACKITDGLPAGARLTDATVDQAGTLHLFFYHPDYGDDSVQTVTLEVKQ